MLTLVWDVDDVLNDLMHSWLELSWLQEHPDCRIHYGDLRENPPDKILGVSRRQYLDSLDRFRLSQAGRDLHPNAEILRWFEEHGSRFRHIALTARPLETGAEAAAWVMKHFGSWIRCFGIVPTRALGQAPVYDGGKGDFLRWLGKGDVLIDDSPANLQQAEAVGLHALAWPQPWNSATLSAAQTLQRINQLA
jgi:hypothetical protein